MAAYLFFRDKEKTRELHSLLSVFALANSEDRQAIKKQLEEWESDP